MQSITDKEHEKVSETAKNIPSTINMDNVYSDEYLGKILDLAGKMYFVQVDIANMAMAEKMNISYSRSLSIGMTGYSVKTSRMLSIPVGISEGSLYIDVDLNKISVVSRKGDRQTAIKYAEATGVASSYYESLIWEAITGEKAVSSISILETAKEENQKIHILSKTNYDEEKQNLNLPSDIRTSIEEAINDGKIVTIHPDEIILDEWKGFGYIITDPYTGAGAYMISGGLSGGSTGADVSLAFLVNTGLDIADIIQSAMLLINISKAFSIGGPVGMAISAVIAVMAVTTIIYAVMDYLTNLELMNEYMEGNETAGDELKLNANINVGITLGVGIFSASAKTVVITAAKSKVVKELGEELAERLLKNTDDATNITKYLKNIKKSGVSQDVIKRVADTSGEAGLKWLEKQTKKDISKEVLEKIVKNADDYTKYSDELMEIIGLYEGRTDDIIEYVNKNGDDGVEEICERFNNHGVELRNGYKFGELSVDSNDIQSKAIQAAGEKSDDVSKLDSSRFNKVNDVDSFLASIPNDATKIAWEPSESIPYGTDKFVWNDNVGNKWFAECHGSDSSAIYGSNAQTGWVYRISVKINGSGKAFYMATDGKFYSEKMFNINSIYYVESIINDTHISINK